MHLWSIILGIIQPIVHIFKTKMPSLNITLDCPSKKKIPNAVNTEYTGKSEK